MALQNFAQTYETAYKRFSCSGQSKHKRGSPGTSHKLCGLNIGAAVDSRARTPLGALAEALWWVGIVGMMGARPSCLYRWPATSLQQAVSERVCRGCDGCPALFLLLGRNCKGSNCKLMAGGSVRLSRVVDAWRLTTISASGPLRDSRSSSIS